MRCPKCRTKSRTKVIDSRLQAGQKVRRRRQCLTCAHRFTTFELPVPVSIAGFYGEGQLKVALKQLTNLAKIKVEVSTIIKKILQGITDSK